MSKTWIFTIVMVVMLASAKSSLAHEFWLEPNKFLVNKLDRVAVTVNVGEPFDGDVFPRNTEHINIFNVVSKNGVSSLVGLEGHSPAGYYAVNAPGLNVVTYESAPNLNLLSQSEFSQYLQEEGIDAIYVETDDNLNLEKTVRELYSRHAKTFIRVGSLDEEWVLENMVPMELDVLPLGSVYSPLNSTRVPFRVVFQGTPLSGVRVTAVNANDPFNRIVARSDGLGEVKFNLNKVGKWMIFAVHMDPSKNNAEVEWRSYWNSLTFELMEGDLSL